MPDELNDILLKEKQRCKEKYKTPRIALNDYFDGEISYGKFVEIMRDNWPKYNFSFSDLQVVRQLAELNHLEEEKNEH